MEENGRGEGRVESPRLVDCHEDSFDFCLPVVTLNKGDNIVTKCLAEVVSRDALWSVCQDQTLSPAEIASQGPCFFPCVCLLLRINMSVFPKTESSE